MHSNFLRTFFSIAIPDRTLGQIDIAVMGLKKNINFDVKWTRLNLMHITLRFIGKFNPSHTEPIRVQLLSELQGFGEFNILFDKIGFFPNKHQPRVIWIGFNISNKLTELVRKVNYITSQYGYTAEKREFSPHLTIGRIKRNSLPNKPALIDNVIINYKLPKFYAFSVKKLNFIKSTLTSRGPIYKSLFEVPF